MIHPLRPLAVLKKDVFDFLCEKYFPRQCSPIRGYFTLLKVFQTVSENIGSYATGHCQL